MFIFGGTMSKTLITPSANTAEGAINDLNELNNCLSISLLFSTGRGKPSRLNTSKIIRHL